MLHDTDGDGVGDNSDLFVNTPNNYVYISVFTVLSIFTVAVLEYRARDSVVTVLSGLEELVSSGIENDRIKFAIQDMKEASGSQLLSPSLKNAKSILNEYTGKTETILQIMEELHLLRAETSGLSGQGAEVKDLIGEVSELEIQLIQEAEADASITYLEDVQKQFVDRLAKGDKK